ncbi:hypothetical protein TBLA_0B07330 [Henningerozyma blattae CBS 6284]|uniref:DNA damage response protein kinase DUN1 n=1 Tax=Henningerozyma blattae (strain ATCC 34711 / CBS 6284 / DSM 70876 / NBRC 10599 / NRRL Y-10934 / UCD 77-7) TaxID=1071380 RepID=I2GZJ9_HENB6|nr:hypothetical protein TBLA_0B07330 [Tetrapisispora blattae CBS 6284]CCH59551.1 hypothetical protein TBLA_0B07330 [Tetrapisispora blattae CBS 6284]
MQTSGLKRERSKEIHVNVKRLQTVEFEVKKAPLAELISLIPGKEQKIDIYDKPTTSVGRSRSCDIVLPEIDISTIHAYLNLVEMEVDNIQRKLINIVDNSRNGTFVNGNKLVKKDQILKNGDKVVFGRSCSFLFKYLTCSQENEEDHNTTLTEKSRENTLVEGGSIQLSEAETDSRQQTDKCSNEVKSTDNDDVFKKPQFGFTSSQTMLRMSFKQPNLSVFDKYVIGKELGSGHYAVVKEGINKKTGKAVAIKIFHPQQNDDQKKSRQFREETNILMSVQHPNIVNLLDSFIEPVSKMQIQKYLVLDKVDDGELFDRIVKKTCLRQDETKALFLQILSGLKYLHSRNVIHRDIKPENILLKITRRTSPDQIQTGPWDEDEVDIQVKIADFGLAKFTGELQFTNTLCGTPSYVAPEVLVKNGYTAKVDIWSSGVLLYVCLCGFPPFSDQLAPPTLKEQILQGKFAFYSPYWDEIDDTVLHLISNLLVVDPTTRFDVNATLNHPWFQSMLQDQDSFSTEIKRLQIIDNKIPKTYSELSCL